MPTRRSRIEGLKGNSPKMLLTCTIFTLTSLLLSQVKAQLSANNSASSLPGLSERANGLNSRYLSAASSSTASLAAATVAAANAVPQGGSASSVGGGSGSSGSQVNNNSQDSNRNYLHQQQQQQAQAHSNSNNVNNNNNNIQQPANQQANNQQVQQLPTQLQVASASTPIMSTTFTFNPLTGQFVPTELATGNYLPPPPPPQVPQAQAQFQASSPSQVNGANNNNNNNNLNSRQQPTRFFSQQSIGISNNNLNSLLQNQQYNGYYNQLLAQHQQPSNAIQRQQQQFNRRNGANQVTTNTRLNQVNNNNNNQQFEEDNGFFQQQQVTNNANNFIIGPASNINAYDQLVGSQVGNNQQLDSVLLNQANAGDNLPGNSYLLNGASNTQYNGNFNGYNLNANQLGNGYQQQQLNNHLNHHHNHHHNHRQQQQQQQQLVPSFVVANEPQSSASVSPAALASSLASSNFNAEYRAEQCVAADGRHGTCYQASECIRRGGTPMGKCGLGSSQLASELSGSSSVCCLFDITCGQFAAERFVYFRNPNYPNSFDQSRNCRARIGKLDKGTCQFRLDMIRFDVAKPTNGNCSSDMLVVSGQNENYVIPKICGFNDGQHYYVGVDESGVINLHMMMLGFYRRTFEILITQIPCKSDFAAPAHCLQYFMGTHGTIKSFNYDDDPSSIYNLQQQQQGNSYNNELLQQDGSAVSLTGNGFSAPYGLNFGNSNSQLQQRQHFALQSNLAALQSGPQRFGNIHQNQDSFGGYPNDLDYTMCIRKESGFCSITYQLSRTESGLQPFAVGQSLFGNGYNNNLNNNSSTGWQSVSTECRDDYLLVGGIRLCGGGSGVGSGSGSGSINGQYESPVASIQFAQNGSILNAAGISGGGQQALQLQAQQLQAQYNMIMQQLARLQQQQVNGGSAGGNVTYASGGPINGSNLTGNQQQQQQQGGNVNNANVEQQQVALIQQSVQIQQQLSLLAAALASAAGNRLNGDGSQQQQQQFDNNGNLQSTIITDTTSGPFFLRFVSNLARNARGFHIDYRQNPCK